MNGPLRREPRRRFGRSPARPARGYVLTLSEEDALALDAYAERVHDHWASIRPPTRYGDPNPTYDNDRLGAYGEFACARLFGFPFDWDPAHSSDDGVDGTLLDYAIQVKSTRPGNRLLVFRDLRHFRADVAILAHVDLPSRRVVVLGWAPRAAFARDHEIRTLSPVGGPQPVMDRDVLQHPDTLVAHLRAARARQLVRDRRLARSVAGEAPDDPPPAPSVHPAD